MTDDVELPEGWVSEPPTSTAPVITDLGDGYTLEDYTGEADDPALAVMADAVSAYIEGAVGTVMTPDDMGTDPGTSSSSVPT